MDYPRMAIVHITFSNQKFQDQDASAVESLLRKNGHVYHLIIHDREIIFYLWAEEKINYNVLDQIKNELQNRKYTGFIISADEYARTGQIYHYQAPPS